MNEDFYDDVLVLSPEMLVTSERPLTITGSIEPPTVAYYVKWFYNPTEYLTSPTVYDHDRRVAYDMFFADTAHCVLPIIHVELIRVDLTTRDPLKIDARYL